MPVAEDASFRRAVMAKSQRLNLLLLVLGIFLVYWTTKPDDHIAYDRSCRVVGIRAEISEAIYGGEFWKLQLSSTDELLGWLQRAPAAEEHEKDNREHNLFEERMTRLSDSHASMPEEQEAEAARLQKERFDQIAWLSSCDAVIRMKLQQ
jgi:hypothetical protein